MYFNHRAEFLITTMLSYRGWRSHHKWYQYKTLETEYNKYYPTVYFLVGKSEVDDKEISI